MKEAPLHILLVDNDRANGRLCQVARAEMRSIRCELAHADRLDKALQSSGQDPYDIILVDFTLSAALMVKTLVTLRQKVPGTPIVLLTEDSPVSCAGVAGEVELRNASRGPGNGDSLARAIRYAVERRRLKETLPRLAFLDDLTGLYNRRGFFLLAEQQLRLARRTKRNLLLLFVDLDGLKQINDTFGHREGDLALTRVAKVLGTTFRASDVIARLGGDEFGVLTWEDSGQSAEFVASRLLQHVEKSNNASSFRHTLSLSLGVARFDPTHMSSVEELMARADEALYAQKRGKRHPESRKRHPQLRPPPGISSTALLAWRDRIWAVPIRR